MPVRFETRPRSWSPQMSKWMGDSARHGKRIDFTVGGGSAYRNRRTDDQGIRITDAGFIRAVNYYPQFRPFPEGAGTEIFNYVSEDGTQRYETEDATDVYIGE